MPDYRYYAADILTGDVLAEMPLFGVYFNRRLSTTGEFTGTFKLGTGQHNDTELIAGSDPGKVAMYVERDSSLIWGGIIWSRTWAEESKTMQLTGQTFESVFDQVVIEQDFVHQTEDQMQIFKALVDAIQLQEANDFNLDTSQIGTSGINRTILIPGYEFHYAQEVVDQLIGVENGFDYTIEILPGSSIDRPQKLIRVGYPKLGLTEQSGDLVYDFPGNIDNFWWPESGGRGGTKFVAIGAGAGVAMLKAQRNAQELLNAGYPAWWIVNEYKGITDEGVLGSMAAADRDRLKMPVSTPTLKLKPDTAAAFESWNDLGSYFTAHLESVRFPGGKDVQSRMIGWELRPSDSEDTEELSLNLEGEDSA